MLKVTPAWQRAYPGALMGILAMQGVSNPDHDPTLDRLKTELEQTLRARYYGKSREDLLTDPVLQAYRTYYKKFKKTYHVLLQLESVVFKSRPIASASALVEASFMAELDTLLLTAIHDLDLAEPPLSIDIATGGEEYTLLRGEPHRCASGDMIMKDGQGVICSLIYGSDQNTQVSKDTQNIVFAVYVPPGIEESVVEKHLHILENNIRLISPNATSSVREIFHAEG
jgi:DNA/RNA-binding domain of Phe-tRNA-synthetase-like protein